MLSKLKIAGVFLFLAGCAVVGTKSHRAAYAPQNGPEFARTAVMITSPNGRSGGTGVILDSGPAISVILTNRHVCQLIQTGGIVVTDNNDTYQVSSFRVYKKHDLCLIYVLTDLGVKTKVANHAPAIYSPSLVSGHPSLLPTMLTPGHFSQKREISLVVDMKPCDGSEKDDEAMICIFTGGKPVIQTYSAQATSSLIMPGSSGSAVFNDKGELSGLIFAGNEGLGYGYLVPWEYVVDFLNHYKHYAIQYPDPNAKPRNFFTSYFKLENACDFNKTNDICTSTERLGLFHE